MKSSLVGFFVLLLTTWVQKNYAQVVSNYAPKFKHQLEYGINYIHFYNNFDENYASTGNIFRYKGIPTWSANYYLGYKLIYKNKQVIKLSNTVFEVTIASQSTTKEAYKIGFASHFYSLGYGYRLDLKNASITFFGLLNYRYFGAEGAIVSSYQDASISEGKYAFSDYASPWGFGTGIELEYFFTKNFGFGINTYLNAFPNENAQFTDNGLIMTQNFIEFNNKQKANTYFINSTFKLAYRFSLPKFGK